MKLPSFGGNLCVLSPLLQFLVYIFRLFSPEACEYYGEMFFLQGDCTMLLCNLSLFGFFFSHWTTILFHNCSGKATPFWEGQHLSWTGRMTSPQNKLNKRILTSILTPPFSGKVTLTYWLESWFLIRDYHRRQLMWTVPMFGWRRTVLFCICRPSKGDEAVSLSTHPQSVVLCTTPTGSKHPLFSLYFTSTVFF